MIKAVAPNPQSGDLGATRPTRVGSHLILQHPMHLLVSVVVGVMASVSKLDANAQAMPPQTQLRQTMRPRSAKGCAAITPDGPW